MLRLLFFLMVLGLASVAQADVSIYVEDFEDEQGNAGFDPLFNHSIGKSPYSNPDYSESWDFQGDQGAPEHGNILALFLAQDTVSFSLNPSLEVIYASIDVQSGGVNSLPLDNYSIDFIGRDGSQRIFQTFSSEWETIEMSSQEIGPIISIIMRSSEGYFDNITIHVVPEPSTVVLGLIGFVISGAVLLRRSRHICR